MRLDKYLKVSRIIKRRTISKELVSLDRAKINGRVAKPSTQVKEGDIVELQLKDLNLTIKVESVPEHIRSNEAHNMYSIVKEEFRKNEE